MAISTQDFLHGIDLTGLVTLNASQIMQVTDTGTPASDKGLIVESTDSALNTPIVPNATVTTKWQRYLWKRRSFADASKVKLYLWDNFAPSVATYLRWVEVTSNVTDAIAIAQDAKDIADEAKVLADAANSNSNTAQTVAQDAQTQVNLANQILADLASIVDNLQHQASSGLFIPGDLRSSTATRVYSKVVNEGWLLADGSAVSRTIFSALFTEIGTVYGAGDGATTFNLPDCRGRVLVGAGTGAGLTNRILGTSFGEETHTLLNAEIPKHTHDVVIPKFIAPGDGTSGGGAGWVISNGTLVVTSNQNTPGDGPHANIQPSIAINIYIKT